MACLVVWIRNVAVRLGPSAKTVRSGAEDATASDGSSQRCQDQRSSIRADFIAPGADFAALIRAAAAFPMATHKCHRRVSSGPSAETSEQRECAHDGHPGAVVDFPKADIAFQR
jgi:hypothetical protein